jgi:hypothetical protein
MRKWRKMDRFREKINKVEYYYVYETPRNCKYEIKDCLLVMVERDSKVNSYTARLANEPRIMRFAWARKPKKAIKYLIDEIVEMHDDCILLHKDKLGEPLKTEIAAFSDYFYVKGEPIDSISADIEPAVAG